MLVFQTNYDGYFIGPNYADQSPLEPGVWLIPGGCVTVEPPQFNPEVEKARWVNNEWTVELIPTKEDAEVTND